MTARPDASSRSNHLPRRPKHSVEEEHRVASQLLAYEAELARCIGRCDASRGVLRGIVGELGDGRLRLRDALRDGESAHVGAGRQRAANSLAKTLSGIVARLTDPDRAGPALEELAALRLHRRVLDRAADAVPAGDSSEAVRQARREADGCKAQLVTANLHVAVAVARRLRRRGVDTSDLVQEGCIGLLRACDKFDPARGTRFGTYAAFWVRQQISRAMVEHATTIRVPLQVAEARHHVERTRRAFAKKNGRLPSEEELASAASLRTKLVATVNALVPDPVSLNATIGAGDQELMASIADRTVERADEALANRTMKAVMKALVRTLSAREAEILSLRFGLEDGEERTLLEVGERFRLSRERVRRIEERALAKLAALGARREVSAFLAA